MDSRLCGNDRLRLVPNEGQGFWAAKEDTRTPVDVGVGDGEPDIGEAVEEGGQGNLAFEAGQGCTKTVMNTKTKTDVAIVLSLYVKGVGLLKLGGVAVGRGKNDANEIAALDLMAV